jgi:hypothetical protein
MMYITYTRQGGDQLRPEGKDFSAQKMADLGGVQLYHPAQPLTHHHHCKYRQSVNGEGQARSTRMYYYLAVNFFFFFFFF